MYWIKKQEKHLLIHNTRTVGKLEKAVDGWKASWHSDSANKWRFLLKKNIMAILGFYEKENPPQH